MDDPADIAWREGTTSGRAAGFVDGVSLGLLKGNQYGHQAGFCRAIAEAVELLAEGSKSVFPSAGAAVTPAEALGPPTRKQKLPAEVIAAADAFPLMNVRSVEGATEGPDMVDQLGRLQAKVKTLLSSGTTPKLLPPQAVSRVADPAAFLSMAGVAGELERDATAQVDRAYPPESARASGAMSF